MGYRPRKTAKKHTMLLPVDLSQRSYLLSRLEWLLMLQGEAHKTCSRDWSAFMAQVAINAAMRDCQKAGAEAEAWALLNGQKRPEDCVWVEKPEPRDQNAIVPAAAMAS